jgi:hypothetical protein
LIEEARVTASRTSRVRALSGLLAGAGLAVTTSGYSEQFRAAHPEPAGQVPAVPRANVNAGTIAHAQPADLLRPAWTATRPAPTAPLEVRIFTTVPSRYGWSVRVRRRRAR